MKKIEISGHIKSIINIVLISSIIIATLLLTGIVFYRVNNKSRLATKQTVETEDTKLANIENNKNITSRASDETRAEKNKELKNLIEDSEKENDEKENDEKEDDEKEEAEKEEAEKEETAEKAEKEDTTKKANKEVEVKTSNAKIEAKNETKVADVKEEAIKEQEKTKQEDNTTKKEEEKSKEEEKKKEVSIKDVKISKTMDLTVRTGLSRENFIKLIAGVKADKSGFFEDNAGTIYDLCKTYNINEIFFCGLISAESGWNIASNHRSTHNYISLMKNGKLIKYSSVYEGLKVAAQKLHTNYLTKGGKFYHGKTLAGVKTCFCPSSGWIDLVYGRMKQII